MACPTRELPHTFVEEQKNFFLKSHVTYRHPGSTAGAGAVPQPEVPPRVPRPAARANAPIRSPP